MNRIQVAQEYDDDKMLICMGTVTFTDKQSFDDVLRVMTGLSRVYNCKVLCQYIDVILVCQPNTSELELREYFIKHNKATYA